MSEYQHHEFLAVDRPPSDDEQAEVRPPLARERRLDKLADEEDAAWSRVEAMIRTRKPAEYDAAVTLLADLQALWRASRSADPTTVRFDVRPTRLDHHGHTADIAHHRIDQVVNSPGG